MNILQRIQTKLKAPKSQFNAFGKYKYRTTEDILEALKPIMAEHEVSLVIRDEIVPLADRVYVKATSELLGKDNKVIAFSTAFAREALSKKGMDEAMVTGTASSYARKYSLNGLFCIDDTTDIDSDAAQQPQPQQPQQPQPANVITEAQQNEIMRLLKTTNSDYSKMIAFAKCDDIVKMTPAGYKKVMAMFKQKAAK